MGPTDIRLGAPHMLNSQMGGIYMGEAPLFLSKTWYQEKNLTHQFRPRTGSCMFEKAPLSTHLETNQSDLPRYPATTNQCEGVWPIRPINTLENNPFRPQNYRTSPDAHALPKPKNPNGEISSQKADPCNSLKTKTEQFSEICEKSSKRSLQNHSTQRSTVYDETDQNTVVRDQEQHRRYFDELQCFNIQNPAAACFTPEKHMYQPHVTQCRNSNFALLKQTELHKKPEILNERETYVRPQRLQKNRDVSNASSEKSTATWKDRHPNDNQNVFPKSREHGIPPANQNILKTEKNPQIANLLPVAKEKTAEESRHSSQNQNNQDLFFPVVKDKNEFQQDIHQNSDTNSVSQRVINDQISTGDRIESANNLQQATTSSNPIKTSVLTTFQYPRELFTCLKQIDNGGSIQKVQLAKKLCQNLTHIAIKLLPRLKVILRKITSEYNTWCISKKICRFIMQEAPNTNIKYLFFQYLRRKQSLCKLVNKALCGVCLYDSGQLNRYSTNDCHSSLRPQQGVNTPVKSQVDGQQKHSPSSPTHLKSDALNAVERANGTNCLLRKRSAKETFDQMYHRLSTECIIVGEGDDGDSLVKEAYQTSKGAGITNPYFSTSSGMKRKRGTEAGENLKNNNIVGGSTTSLDTFVKESYSTFVYDESNLELTTVEFGRDDWEQMMKS